MKPSCLLPLFAALAFAMPALAQNAWPLSADATRLDISASGEATHAPDIATVSTGVVTQAADGNGAMRANAAQMDKLLAAVRNAGIADKDIQTSSISLSPQYRYPQNQPPQRTGFEARNTLSVKIRDLSKSGKIVDALAAAGASEINGPNFSIENPEPLYQQARIAALKKAQAQADVYAQALGLRVRRVVNIGEGGGMARPMPMMKAMSMAAPAPPAPATDIEPGESSVTVNLDVVFELGK